MQLPEPSGPAEDALERSRLAVEIEGENEQAGVAELPAGARAQESADLINEAGLPPRGLLLERAE